MATFRKFEEIEAWQKARELCGDVHKLVRKPEFSKDLGLVRQVQNSSGSTMDNIAEGFERDGTKEFLQFLSISKAPCAETQSQLYRAIDNGYIDQTEFELCFKKAEDAKAKIAGLMIYLNQSDFKGVKFKDRK